MSTKMASEKPQTQELVGTGGTKLIPFLRTSSDETYEAPNARSRVGKTLFLDRGCPVSREVNSGNARYGTDVSFYRRSSGCIAQGVSFQVA